MLLHQLFAVHIIYLGLKQKANAVYISVVWFSHQLYKSTIEPSLRELVITSLFEEDPPGLGEGGYRRHHLSGEHY